MRPSVLWKSTSPSQTSKKLNWSSKTKFSDSFSDLSSSSSHLCSPIRPETAAGAAVRPSARPRPATRQSRRRGVRAFYSTWRHACVRTCGSITAVARPLPPRVVRTHCCACKSGKSRSGCGPCLLRRLLSGPVKISGALQPLLGNIGNGSVSEISQVILP